MNGEQAEKTSMEIDLLVLAQDMLRGARRLLWLGALLIAAGAALLAGRVWSSYSPLYQASATFTVSVSNPLYAGVRTYNASAAEQMALTFPYILTSDALSELVMEELELAYLPQISASVVENTNIFTLSVTSGDPELAYDVLGAVIRCYPSVAEFVVGSTEMELLDETGLPAEPVNRPDYLGALRRGAVLGGLLWLGIVLLFALTRSTVHSEKELEEIMNLRCLSVLPMTKGYRRGPGSRECPLLTQGNDKFGFAESVRLLRLRVEKEMREQGKKVLLVSSAIPGEGKTTVAVNLAVALAQKGRKTLLVDCDLRNPSVAGAFGKEELPGLSAYLNRQRQAKDLISRLEPQGLHVVFGGPPVQNAAELLAKREMREFMALVRNSYDYVILDTPPSSLLADAAELAELADCALLVIRENDASRGQILDGVQMMADSGLHLVGCALNGAGRGPLKEAAGYSSYYGYGGSYGSY